MRCLLGNGGESVGGGLREERVVAFLSLQLNEFCTISD